MTRIFFEVDGTPVPADECAWVVTAPCGCECSWNLGAYTTSEDKAWQDYAVTKAMRRHREEQGYRMSIKRIAGQRLGDDCPHKPKWGVQPRIQIDGHTWAATRTGRVLHLVPAVIERNSLHHVMGELVTSVCGREDSYVWSTQWHLVSGRLDCAPCLTKANRLKAVTPVDADVAETPDEYEETL